MMIKNRQMNKQRVAEPAQLPQRMMSAADSASVQDAALLLATACMPQTTRPLSPQQMSRPVIYQLPVQQQQPQQQFVNGPRDTHEYQRYQYMFAQFKQLAAAACRSQERTALVLQ